MKNPKALSYLLLSLCIGTLLGISGAKIDPIRGQISTWLNPLWASGRAMRSYFQDRPIFFFQRKDTLQEETKLAIETELFLVKQQLAEAKASISATKDPLSTWVLERIQHRGLFLTAKILHRDPSTWSSTFWIDIGQKDNRLLGTCLVAKDSPVIVGNSLVGVVDYVGETHAKVRMITDGNLTCSVQVMRKGQELLHIRGELHGSSAPFWLSRRDTLQGIGFHQTQEHHPDTIQPGDILITTGLDGVFPPHLFVAKVTEIESFKREFWKVAIQAEPIAPDLHTMQYVWVLPPLTQPAIAKTTFHESWRSESEGQ